MRDNGVRYSGMTEVKMHIGHTTYEHEEIIKVKYNGKEYTIKELEAVLIARGVLK